MQNIRQEDNYAEYQKTGIVPPYDGPKKTERDAKIRAIWEKNIEIKNSEPEPDFIEDPLGVF